MISLFVKEETGSTNDDAWGLYQRGVKGPFAVFAARQLRGRGRRGSEWFSSLPGNIHLSLLVMVKGPISRWSSFIPLRAALGAVEVLRYYTDLSIGVKWPNDLMAGYHKIGGILVESRGAPGGRELPLVIGIGINVNSSQDDYPAMMKGRVATLGSLTGRRYPLIDIALKIIYNLEECIREHDRHAGIPRWKSGSKSKGDCLMRENR